MSKEKSGIDLDQSFSITINGKPIKMPLREAFEMVATNDVMHESGPAAGQQRPLTAKEMADRMTLIGKLDQPTLVMTIAEKAAVQEMLRFMRPAFSVPLNKLIEG